MPRTTEFSPTLDPTWLIPALEPFLTRDVALVRAAAGESLGFVDAVDAVRAWSPQVAMPLPPTVFTVWLLRSRATGAVVHLGLGKRSFVPAVRGAVSRHRATTRSAGKEQNLLDLVTVAEHVRVHASGALDAVDAAAVAFDVHNADYIAEAKELHLGDDPDMSTRLAEETDWGRRLRKARERGPQQLPITDDPVAEALRWQQVERRRNAEHSALMKRYAAERKAGIRPPLPSRKGLVRARRAAAGDRRPQDVISEIVEQTGHTRDSVRAAFRPHAFRFPRIPRIPLRESTRTRRREVYRAYLEGGQNNALLPAHPGFEETIRAYYPELYPILERERPDLVDSARYGSSPRA